MAIELKKDCKYSLLVATSMGVRLTPADGQPMHCGGQLSIQVTSAESNVASVSSFLGLPVKVLTAFVNVSPIARLIKDDLASRHMDFEGRDELRIPLIVTSKIESEQHFALCVRNMFEEERVTMPGLLTVSG